MEDSQEGNEPEIDFNQQSSTNRAELANASSNTSNFADVLSEKIGFFSFHSFIAKVYYHVVKEQKTI